MRMGVGVKIIIYKREQMPKESKSQEIGRIGVDFFRANIPRNWIAKELDGDTDYGLDFLIQYKNKNDEVTYNFFVQIKTTSDEKNIQNEYVKVKLKSHTLNYYQNNGLILLVACDAREADNPKYYYEFLHNILKELYGNKRVFDDAEKEYPIKVSTENVLNKNLDIQYVLESYAKGNHTNQRKFGIMEECDIGKIFEDSKEDYEEIRTLYGNSFLRKKGRVYVDAHVPSEYDFSISILIIFRLDDAERAMITPDEKTILSILFSGYKSKPNSDVRKWFKGKTNDEFSIQIGDVWLNVPVEVIIDLSDILDDLFEVYTERIDAFENTLKSKQFQPSKTYRNGFKLMRIKRGLWYQIHKFANKYRFRDGDTEWHIFGYDNYSLVINFRDKPFIWSGNIIISPEADNGYGGYKSIDDEVVLTWESLPREKYERKDIENKILNVEEVHEWLINTLIPKVICEYENENIKLSWFERKLNIKRTINYSDFISRYKSDNYVVWSYKYPVAEECESGGGVYLLKIATELQSCYRAHDSLFIDAEQLVKLYGGVIILLQNSSLVDLRYLYGNLNDLKIIGELSLSSFIDAIKKHIDDIDQATTNQFRIDLILRCYIALIEDNAQMFSDEVVGQIITNIEPIVHLKKTLETRNRMLQRFG